MGLLDGQRGLVAGIANQRSIAYGIAKAARREGAELALSYQGEALKKRVEPIADELGGAYVLKCDLQRDEHIAALAQALRERWDSLDFVVHAVAFAHREDLEGRFIDTSRQGFAVALDVSVYTLVALARACEPLLAASKHSPSILTLTYYGSEKALPHYNVMGVAKAALEASVRYLACDLGPRGIRVNALSPGPIKTLSAAGIKGLRSMLAHAERAAPLRRNVDIEDVGLAALGLLSALGRGTTGEIVHVDAGYHVLGATPQLQGEEREA